MSSSNHPLAALVLRIRRGFPDELKFRLQWPVLDYNGDYKKSVFLAGVARSGTTWVSNIINYNNRYRDMFEPFHSHYVYHSRRFIYPLYIRPESKIGNYLRPARRILTGQILHPWIDRNNRRFFVNRRLIKEIRANMWLKWLKVNFPELPIILLFRHPCAVAESRLILEWPTRLQQFVAQNELMQDHLEPFRDLIMSAETPFERHIVVWCLQYYVPLRQFRQGELHIAYYENFLAKPEEEIHKLFAYLNQRYDARIYDALKRPAVTTYLRTDPRSNLIDSWRARFSQAQVKKAVEILACFGLDRVYGEEALPNEQGANKLLRGEDI